MRLSNWHLLRFWTKSLTALKSIDCSDSSMGQITQSAGTNLVLCSLALFLLPLSVFFVVYCGGLDFILQRLARGGVVTSWTRAVTGAVLAVITINAVLIAFVVTAFGETPEEMAKKED